MSKLFAYLSYRDVDAAITWLEALGVESHDKQQDSLYLLGRVLSPAGWVWVCPVALSPAAAESRFQCRAALFVQSSGRYSDSPAASRASCLPG